MDRFYCPTVTTGSVVELDQTEAHHLVHVLRQPVGSEVELFDGKGHAATAEIVRISRRSATLRISGNVATDPPPSVPLTLAVAAPKGDRFRWLVEKATELGVTSLAPLITERSVAEPGDSRITKLEQTVIAACKQSRRNTFMQIQHPQKLSEAIASAGGSSLLIAHPGGVPLASWLDPRRNAPAMPVILLIGPEGGFTDHDLAAAINAGATAVSLGANILRVETAALALAAAILLTQT